MDRIAPEDLPRMRDRFGRRARGERGQSSYELTTIAKDGRRVPIEVTASDVTIDGRRAVFAFIVDVSARKKAEEAGRRTEARFRDLIQWAPDPTGIIREGYFVSPILASAPPLAYP